MKKKNIIKISIIVFSILVIVTLALTTTQAYFNKDNYANNPTEYQSGLLSIEAVSKSSNISLSNTLPMSDTEGEQTEPYVFTIKNNGNVDYKFNIKLLSTSDNTFSPEYIKIKIDDENVKTLSSLTDSIIKKDIILSAGETIDITLRLWLSIDTKNTEIGKTFNSKIVIDGQSVYTSSNQEVTYQPTKIEDFTYYLINPSSSVSTIEGVEVTPITSDSNTILLTKYNGTSKTVYIPNTYTIDGTTYDVMILSYVALSKTGILSGDVSGVFCYNTNIENVKLGNNVKFVTTGTNSKSSKLNDATILFWGCKSLVNVSGIPNSVTNMSHTFDGCTSLVNAPEIPDSVTNMSYTFFGCTSLENTPKIPDSVTNMSYTFSGCTNLTGLVKINSSNVSNVDYIFTNTSKSITVSVPSGSTTYTKLNALTTTNGKPSNVTLTTY